MNAAPLARILIVDDEAALMRALCDTLRDQGYETAGYTTGEEALAALQEQPFDLLLTDLMMPGMDGVALLAAALKIDPRRSHISAPVRSEVATAANGTPSSSIGRSAKSRLKNSIRRSPLSTPPLRLTSRNPTTSPIPSSRTQFSRRSSSPAA